MAEIRRFSAYSRVVLWKYRREGRDYRIYYYPVNRL